MASSSETFEVTAGCLCKTHTFSAKVALSKLPLLASVCHCTSCRRVTGALYSSGATWPQRREEVDTSKLKRYVFSESITIMFCEKCSTPLFVEYTKMSSGLFVVTGALKNSNVDLVKFARHIFVGDTVDGGATMWLMKPNTDGREVPRYKEGSNSEEYPSDWPPVSAFTGYEKKTENTTMAVRCHCKGVDFLMSRGEYEGKPKDELPWFVDPNSHKLLASFDACDSCRLQFGADVFNWTFSELENIYLNKSSCKEGSRVVVKTTLELRAAVDAHGEAVGTLGYYQSSADVQRYFCKVCSAAVFYAVDERPGIVDVAVGLLDATDGARVEGSLSWSFGGRIAWLDDTKGGWREGLFQRVLAEAEQWRINRSYPKNWRRIEREERGELF